MVTHPSFPSRTAINRSRVNVPETSGFTVPTTSSASPTSNLRTTLHTFTSKLSVNAIGDLQVYILSTREAKTVFPIRVVIQPASSFDFPCRVTSLRGVSFLGPSKSSTTSPDSICLTTAESGVKPSCRATSAPQERYGLGAGFKKVVPWLPFTVTHPTASSRSARPRTRRTWDLASSSGASRHSKNSSTTSLRIVFEDVMSKESVITMPLAHT
mmetsp:Transcript_25746/g.67400  ORF Transcript_25746/g.67400 Transcript_25746/m.67400 type:complete len:213 (-) Transcript_25746:4670-5308(-)